MWVVLLVTKLCRELLLLMPTIQLLLVMVDEAGWLFFSNRGKLNESERLHCAETTSDAGEGWVETAALSTVGMIQEWIPFDKSQVSIVPVWHYPWGHAVFREKCISLPWKPPSSSWMQLSSCPALNCLTVLSCPAKPFSWRFIRAECFPSHLYTCSQLHCNTGRGICKTSPF